MEEAVSERRKAFAAAHRSDEDHQASGASWSSAMPPSIWAKNNNNNNKVVNLHQDISKLFVKVYFRRDGLF